MGNLGWDDPKEVIEQRAREVLAKVGAKEPTQLRAPFRYGSICNIKWQDSANGWSLRDKVRKEKVIIEGRSKPIWLDVKKTAEELKPSRVVRKAEKKITLMESRPGRNGKVEGCTMAKKVYVDSKPIGGTIKGKWTWLAYGTERYIGEDLQAIADEINQ